jgi:hypothetical protein
LVGSAHEDAAVCVRHVISDQNGNLYAVTESGELLHNRHADGDPERPLIYPGTGRRIAVGFQDIRRVISWGEPSKSHLALITSDGTMFYNRVERPESAAPPLVLPAIGSRVTTGWGNVSKVFCDQTGAVYSLSPSGELHKNQLIVIGNQATLLQPELENRLGSGWTGLLHVFSAGPGRFLSVDLGGVLRYNDELPLVPGSAPRLAYPGAGVPVVKCWDTLVAIFSAGGGGIYAITTEGDLLHSRLRVDGRRPPLMSPGHGKSVGKVCQACRLSTMVEGYCWPLSVAPGETIDFKVSVNPQGALQKGPVTYRVRYLRLRRVVQPVRPSGYIDVSDHRPMGSAGPYTAEFQDAGPRVWETGCNWKSSFQLTIPRDGAWRSGLYAAECCPDGADPSEAGAYYVVFVVNPPVGERTKLAVLSNINTWNAYNCWGGSSKYCCHDGSPLPRRLSFERPNPATCPSELQTRECPAVRPQTAHLTRAELWVLTWLEDNGYPFHLYSDHDLDRGIEGISKGDWRYEALMLNTHPEYWTTRMHGNLERYVSGGGSVIYLGGNGIYEQVEYERRGKAMQVLQHASDADLATCDNNHIRKSSLFRNLGRPERAILGVGYEYVDGQTAAPYEVTAPEHPLLDRVVGTTIGTEGLYCPASGWEMDVRGTGTPSGTTLLARGTNAPGNPTGAEMVYRQIRQNFVFSVGSLSFGASLVVDNNLQQILKNVLALSVQG